MKITKKDILKIFAAHGVEFLGTRGDQMYGSCPFSGKEDKFYVNVKNGLWDSKSAGVFGNISKFLQMRSDDYRKELSGKLMAKLAENRQLPREAFKGWNMGWDGAAFTFPVYNYDNVVQDIRRYKMRAKLMLSTSGCKVGLFGAHRLKDAPKDEPVYICEGEWDAIALSWLLKKLEEPGIVVAVPGAGTFKAEWVPWLSGRIVHTLYDYDPPGRQGEEKVLAMLKGSVRELTFVHWPDEVPIGFDTRDWIIYGAVLNDTPEKCWERLQRRFHKEPKWALPVDPATVVTAGKGHITIKRKKPADDRWKTPPTLEDVHNVFGKWLFLRTTEVIDVVLATVLSQRIDGSPSWMFIVGPPGSAKTAIVSALEDVLCTYATSTITAPSLISGANFTGAGDPSLIPQLDGKVLVVKDFTSILSLPDREQKEIFGILRDAYDGHCGKTFGNGINRKYDSRFTVLAATTPRIYDLSDQHAALGERFLKFLVGDNLHHISENEVIRRAIENADRETAMRTELKSVVKNFLERTCDGRVHPRMPEELLVKTISLAKFGARMRGSVSRDFYRSDIMMSRPMAEVGTRLGQQLAKLARGLAMVYGKPEVTEVEYSLIKKVMLDTISQRNEDVLRSMIQAMGGTSKMTPMSMREIALKTHYPFATIQRLMQDLQSLQIIQRVGAGVSSTWTLSDYVRDEVMTSGLYTPDDLSRPGAGKIRMKMRRIKEAPRKIRAVLGKVSASTQGTKITLGVIPSKPSDKS